MRKHLRDRVALGLRKPRGLTISGQEPVLVARATSNFQGPLDTPSNSLRGALERAVLSIAAYIVQTVHGHKRSHQASTDRSDLSCACRTASGADSASAGQSANHVVAAGPQARWCSAENEPAQFPSGRLGLNGGERIDEESCQAEESAIAAICEFQDRLARWRGPGP